jgi:hypothetical protein
MSSTFEIGRASDTGRFIPVEEAQRRKATATVEKIKVRKPKRQRKR